jgi:phthiocerol/phenolphthiocerol synthesis type-I polyketide synthase C
MQLSQEPLAIVGIGCRLPGGIASAEALWQFLRAGGDASSDVPPDRWDLSRFLDPASEQSGSLYTGRGSFLERFDHFDPGFFGFPPREARAMDPQQRLLLETTWEALEDANLVPDHWAGRRVGVFVGLFTHDFEILRSRPSEAGLASPYAATGSSATIAANRISHVFDFKGPSMVIDTACSSSLVAVHQACRSLLSGEAELALAGGVNLQLVPETTQALCQARMLAPDGRCKSFDARANGYARADGVAMVALMRLSDAVRRGAPIYATILGSATNQDGATPTITMPDRSAQEQAIRDALAAAGLAASDITYVEAHGTGTPTGDPIEASALGAVLGSARPKGQPCVIGSIKSNIGHTESTAGVAGLIKAALMIHRAEILPNIHFETPNPAIPFEDLNLRVATAVEPWNAPNGRFAGVNSFGFGGSNAHVILAEAPAAARRPGGEGPALLCLSARSATSLRAAAARHAALLEGRSPDALALGDLAGVLAQGRSLHAHRLAVAASDRVGAIAALKAAAEGARDPGLVVESPAPQGGKLAFVFSGMGQQWWAMGRQLRGFSEVFDANLREIDARFARHTDDWSLLAELEADADRSRIDRTEIAQPAIFAIQVALAAMWRDMGVTPDLIVGHSVGEVAAAHVCGALDLEQAVSVSFHRARLQARTAGQGGMLAVGLPEREIGVRIDAFARDICIAAVNSPRSVTLAGDRTALQRLEGLLSRDGVFARLLNVEVPYHSPAMDVIAAPLRDALRDIRGRTGGITMISTVTGAPLDGASIDADYWFSNVRAPVSFARAMDRLAALGAGSFVEIGAHPVLSAAIRENLALSGRQGAAIASQRREANDTEVFLEALGMVRSRGHAVDLSRLHPIPDRPLFLPGYAWDHSQILLESNTSRQQRLGIDDQGVRLHPLLGIREDSAQPRWRGFLTPGRPAYLADHMVRDAVLFPAAGFIEVALAASARAGGTGTPAALADLRIERPVVLDHRHGVHMNVAVDQTDSLILHASTSEEEPRQWARHLHCRFLPADATPIERRDLHTIKDKLGQLIEAATIYAALDTKGLQYGPGFRNLTRAWIGPAEGLGQIIAGPGIIGDLARYHLHPAMLDACFHLLALMPGAGTYLPSSCRRIELLCVPGEEIWAHVRVTAEGVSRIEADLELLHPDGTGVARLSGMVFRRFEDGTDTGTIRPEGLYRQCWIAAPLAGTPQSPACLPAPVFAAPDGNDLAEVLERLARDLVVEKAQMSATTDALQTTRADRATLLARTLAQAPHLGPEVIALHYLAAQAAVPSGADEGPALPAAMAEPLRSDGASARATHSAMVKALAPLLAKASRAGNCLRILHLNAGASPLLARLLAQLDPEGCVYRAALYPHAPADPVALLRVSYPFLEVMDGIPVAEGPMQEAFDLIIIEEADTLPNGSSSVDLCTRISNLSAPGGRLVLGARRLERTLWQKLLDRGEGNAPGQDWRPLLAEAGFDEITIPALSLLSRQMLVCARHPGVGAPPPVPFGAGADALILVLGAESALAAPLITQLEGLGARPFALGENDVRAEMLQPLLASADTAENAIVVDLRATLDVGSGDDPAGRAEAGCQRFAHATISALDAGPKAGISYWVVTTDAQPAGGQNCAAIDQAALWGFARSLVNEEPTLALRLVDLGATPDSAEVALLAAQILNPDAEDEIALRGGRRLVHRLMPDNGLGPVDGTGGRFTLCRRRRRPPADLVYIETHAAAPMAPGEVHLQLQAAAINYKDAAITAGLLDATDRIETGTIGLEGSGTVIAVAPDVEGLVPGDSVYGVIDSIAHPARTFHNLLQPKPAKLSHAAAAGISVVMTSALHALEAQAHLRAGETVLIHSATSSLGLAAVQIARHLGARVLATAGSDAKRSFLAGLGVEVIGSSRDASFVAAALAATGGKGVDVILSALPGSLMQANLDTLRKGTGRLIDVANIHYDSQLAFNAMVDGVSISAFELRKIADLNPDHMSALMARINRLLNTGALSPLPYRQIPADGAFDVLRRSLRGAHIGRNVIDLTQGSMPIVPAPAGAPITLDPEGCYLVSGGLSGLGLALAERLAGAGARHLLLLGRRGAHTPEAAAMLARLGRMGVSVTALSCDVSDPGQVAAAVARCGADLPRLRGIIHAAGLLRDMPVRDMTGEQLNAVLAPKARGGWNLHQASLGCDLDFFVAISSLANTIGNLGQANYSAANEFLDALVHHRRAAGLPGLALVLGVIGDVGFVARDADLRASVRRVWRGEIRVDEIWSLMRHALQKGQSHPVYAVVEWDQISRVMRNIARAPRFAPVARDSLQEQATRAAATAFDPSDSPQERHARLSATIRAEVAGVLGLAVEALDPLAPLAAQGFDSLLSVELILSIERRVGVTLKQGALLRADLTVEGLIAEIEAALAHKPEASDLAATGPAPTTPEDVAGIDVDALSDAEVEALLQKLETEGSAQ